MPQEEIPSHARIRREKQPRGRGGRGQEQRELAFASIHSNLHALVESNRSGVNRAWRLRELRLGLLVRAGASESGCVIERRHLGNNGACGRHNCGKTAAAVVEAPALISPSAQPATSERVSQPFDMPMCLCTGCKCIFADANVHLCVLRGIPRKLGLSAMARCWL